MDSWSRWRKDNGREAPFPVRGQTTSALVYYSFPMQDMSRDLPPIHLASQWKNLTRLNREEKDFVQRSRGEANAFNIRIVALLAGSLFLLFWLGVFMGDLVDRADPFWPHYLAFFGAAAVFAFLFLILRKLKPGAGGFSVYLGASLAAVVGLNLLGMYRTGDRSIYLLALMICALLYSAPLRWYAIAFSAAWFASILGMVLWLPGPRVVNNALVLAAITALSLVTAVTIELRRVTAEILSLRLKQKNEELLEISLRDPLTGLYNRRFLRGWLRQTIARAERECSPRPLILAIIDLDRFKELNDGAGHGAGDEALKKAAAVFLAGLRRADVIARYGGDEFIAVMPDTTVDQARFGMERCLAELKSVSIPSWPDLISFSCGLAAWTSGMDENELITMADNRLYREKGLGRSRVVAEESSG